MTTQNHRLHALDALRGHMMLLGIVLHAGLCYGTGDVGPIWVFRDSQEAPAIGTLVGLIGLFRMPVFFIVSGFFFQMLLERKGSLPTAKDRLSRIVPPFLLFLPITIALSSAATWWAIENLGVDANIMADGAWFQPHHLWFLYYLSFYYVLILAVHRLLTFTRLSFHWLAKIPFTAGALLFGGLLGGLTQMLAPFVMEPMLDFTLQIRQFFYFLLFFICGQWIYLKKHTLHELPQKVWWLLLMVIVLAGSGAASISFHDRDLETISFLETAALGSAMFSLCFLFFAAYLRWGSKASPMSFYISKSSYWVYLVHLPLVMGVFILLNGFDLSPYIKFTLNVIITTALCMLSYRYFVHNKWMSRFLEGRAWGEVLPRTHTTAQQKHIGESGHRKAGVDSY
ncbi:predicted acyltransferase 3 [gamma proteobacterium HdN1]|nr:predicted acyltransferase 3 [gamma proteobacterium HdN1]